MGEIALEHLKEADIRILVRHPDPEKRTNAALRICRTYRAAELSDKEKTFAHDLLKFMAQDAVAMVRRALAITLKNSPALPRSVAIKLASDIDDIAIPILENSPVFTEEDLIEVLRSRAASKVTAVARRPIVSGNLVREIVRYGDSLAVAEVAANDGAIIDEKTAEDILEFYHNDDLIKEAFISRTDLPVRIMEKLITQVSEEAAVILNREHNINALEAIEIGNKARERATIELVEDDFRERELREFTEHLLQNGRLTPSFIIRAIGLGRMSVVKYALACMAGVSPNKADLMLFDAGPFGLKSLCILAGLSDINARIIRAGCAIYRDLEISGIEYDAEYFQTLMLQRILTLPLDINEQDQKWLLDRLDASEDEAA